MLLEMLAHQQRVAQAGLITAGLAHDVSNHLQLISGGAYLAATCGRPSEMKAALEKIQSQCVELAETTRAFLDFVKRRDATQKQRFLISDVLSQADRLLTPLAKPARVSIETVQEGDARVAGEARLLIQALVNLGANAIRACPAGSGRVTLVASAPMPGWCMLEVKDDGAGIPEEMRQRLFRPFATGHAASGGNGLGLFIVRQAVRSLGGDIRVRTSPEGTSIKLSLPTV